VLLFLGCVYSYQDPRAVAAIVRVLEAAGVEYGVLGADEGCCGYIDLLAGAEGAFDEVARERAEAILETGAGILVTPCAGCHRSFSQLYREAVPAWPADMEVLHLVEFLDRLLEEGSIPLADGGEVSMIAYHDPCDLGRHSGVYDAPRRVLAALPGVVVEEFPEAREEAGCCGGGGALRAFDAVEAQRIGGQRLSTLVEGIDAVATACPSCKGNLRLAAAGIAREGGPRRRVLDVVEVVASRLEGGGRR
jgi:glycolate oxidase